MITRLFVLSLAWLLLCAASGLKGAGVTLRRPRVGAPLRALAVQQQQQQEQEALPSAAAAAAATRLPWWRGRGDVGSLLLAEEGETAVAVDVKKAFAFSKWMMPASVDAEGICGIDADITPLLCFVNRDSGGRRGKALLESLRSLPLNPLQVCDLKDSSPGSRLESFRCVSSRVNVLCCGGDGTINWVMDELSRLNMTVGSFGIIPLGTGNDLYLQTFQRTLQEQQRQISAEAASAASAGSAPRTSLSPASFSYAVSPEQLVQAPLSVLAHHAWNLQCSPDKSNQIELNRWRAVIQTTGAEEFAAQQMEQQKQRTRLRLQQGGLLSLLAPLLARLSVKRMLKIATLPLGAKRNQTLVFSNYMGFGVDGAVSLSFSHLRSAAPFLFFSSFLNKLWYGLCGLYQVLLGKHRRDLSSAIHITCDGRAVPVPPGIRGLVALNINSYAGGTRLWNADEPTQRGFGARLGSWGSASMSDGVLEVVGVYGIRHLGLIKSGLASAVPVCQGRSLVFNCTIQTPMQVDGEPFVQKPCVVRLGLAETVRVTVPVVTGRLRPPGWAVAAGAAGEGGEGGEGGGVSVGAGAGAGAGFAAAAA